MKQPPTAFSRRSLLRRTRTVRRSHSPAAALFATSLIGLGYVCPPKARGLLSLRGSFGGVLKHTLGAGVMDELTASDKPFGHRDLAPGAHTFRQVGAAGEGNRLGHGYVSHGRHSR
jgi:hypothetical protein